jgi:hypothetical protein
MNKIPHKILECFVVLKADVKQKFPQSQALDELNEFLQLQIDLNEVLLQKCHTLEKMYEHEVKDNIEKEAAIKTLQALGYSFNGGELWKPPLKTS